MFLNLENIRGAVGSPALQVYIRAPGGREMLAGSVGLFGLRKASMADSEHAGQGLTSRLEITKIVDELHVNNAFDVNTLEVRIVPLRPVPGEAQVSIGRVSIFRQGR